MEIDGDYNRIALDTAIGGCFGETLSAMTYEDQLNIGLKGMDIDNAVRQKFSGIAVDEVEHAALAWTTVKWIIGQFEDTEVGKREWWTQELTKRDRASQSNAERIVYGELIPSMVDFLFN